MKIRFYIATGPTQVAGGIKQIYRQVDVLSSLGFDAAVSVPSDNLRPEWFDSDTKTVLASSETLTKDDYLVVGEQISKIPDGPEFSEASLVIYVQNPYGVMKGFGKGVLGVLATYRDKVNAVICVSEHSREVLSWLLKCDVYRVRYSFDRPPFGMPLKKKKMLSYMPRKAGDSLRYVVGTLQAKGVISKHNWEIFEILEMSEEEVARALGESSIFISGSTLEGFGMPPAEAMACSCVVVGFTGAAGVEFIKPEYSFPIEQGDVFALTMKIAELMSKSDDELLEIGHRASKWIRSAYSTEKEIESIRKAWEGILA